MNVQIGDLAKIVESDDERNLGKVVLVVEKRPACEDCGKHMWLVECLEPTYAGQDLILLYLEVRMEAGQTVTCHDHFLRKIEGPKDEEPAPPAQLIKPLEYT